MNHQRRLRAIILLSLVAAGTCLTGCSGRRERPAASFHGIVTLDGKPLEEGSIHFTSPRTGEVAYVNLEKSGTYEVSFPEVDLGEEYEVAVAPTVITFESKAHTGFARSMNVKLPKKYMDRRTSGLRAKIEQPGKNQFDFVLTGS